MNQQSIPFIDLQKVYGENKRAIDSAIFGVLQKGVFVLGQNVNHFEKEFASYLRTKHAIGVASGTDALILALRALEVGKGDEVILPVNSYPTAFAVAATGAVPRFVDIDQHTYTIDTSKISRVIRKKTKAIISVHLYGRVAGMDQVLTIARHAKLNVIEDVAQAHGAVYKGKKAGTIGDIGCFSFYPTKNLGCFGDGGMVVTNNAKIARIVRALRVYGEEKRYKSSLLGVNSRLDEIHAAVLRVLLKNLDMYNKRRMKIASLYAKELKGLPITFPGYDRNGEHVFHLFVVEVRKREKLKKQLSKKGIHTAIHYPVPAHLVSSFRYLGYKKGDFPAAEKASKRILSLPCYPHLTDKEVITICNEIKNIIR